MQLYLLQSHQAIFYVLRGPNPTDVSTTGSIFGYLRIMNVGVKPAVESAELRPNQDEGRGDLSSLQEPVQVIHHPGRQQHSSVPVQNKRMQRMGPEDDLFCQLGHNK